MKTAHRRRVIDIGIAVRRAGREGVTFTARRLRQILMTHQNRSDGIKARQLCEEGKWHIDSDSFDDFLESRKFSDPD